MRETIYWTIDIDLRFPADHVGGGHKSEDLPADYTIYPRIPGPVHSCAIAIPLSAAIPAH